ncbi:MAG: hypothetical protein IJ349_10980 [Clostridia bacterium]|nr:hypothetical protein [Clostridia bacterium]
MEHINKFDELKFFAEVKKCPNLFFGKPSLLSLRDHMFGMSYAFSVCDYENQLRYFYLFTDWYYKNLTDKNGYACWWNHILYISGNDDAAAFHSFFRIFEQYLKDVHNVSLPEV